MNQYFNYGLQETPNNNDCASFQQSQGIACTISNYSIANVCSIRLLSASSFIVNEFTKFK